MYSVLCSLEPTHDSIVCFDWIEANCNAFIRSESRLVFMHICRFSDLAACYNFIDFVYISMRNLSICARTITGLLYVGPVHPYLLVMLLLQRFATT